MSQRAWIITADHLQGEDVTGTDVGMAGPRGITPEQVASLQAGEGREFRLYDDDQILYYTGRSIWSDDEEGTEGQVFGPLDDFGAPNAGCTLIKWRGDADFA